MHCKSNYCTIYPFLELNERILRKEGHYYLVSVIAASPKSDGIGMYVATEQELPKIGACPAHSGLE